MPGRSIDLPEIPGSETSSVTQPFAAANVASAACWAARVAPVVACSAVEQRTYISASGRTRAGFLDFLWGMHRFYVPKRNGLGTTARRKICGHQAMRPCIRVDSSKQHLRASRKDGRM